jgi:hypothetical protein
MERWSKVRRAAVAALVLALIMAAVVLTGCERKVTVTTGEIVICTAGEVIEDNTSQIEVPASEAAKYAVTTTVITCERHSDLGTLYAEAQEAIASGDLVAAREKLQSIVDRDPAYRRASEQLKAISEGKTPPADTADEPAAGGDTNAPPSEEPVGPVVNLAKWVPDVIPGYIAQGILADPASLARQYIPESDAADQMVIAVDQYVDAQAAQQKAAALGTYYPENTGTRKVGSYTVTVGVKGDFAAAAFSDGPLVIAVELHATRGGGAALIDAALDVVAALTR